MNKKVCLVTPNHISTNPRLVKEAISLDKAGYKVHIIFTQHTEYSSKEDFNILRQNPDWEYDVLDWTSASKKSKFNRFYSGFVQKMANYLSRKFSFSLLNKLILNRHFFFQLKAALKTNADLIIAHNAGALAVAADAAKKKKKLFAFDAEDFHRGQELSSHVLKATIAVEDQYLPKAAYITAASSLIAEEYEQLYKVAVPTVRNVFPLINVINNNTSEASLKLFWFSQTVGTNRGLQDVFRAMKILEKYKLEFYIYGYLSKEVKNKFDDLLNSLNFINDPKIFFKDPVSPDNLLIQASKYDIGFATEPGFCKNNEIALSNKIFTYLVGGNAIVLSDTPAQSHFYKQYPNLGFIYTPNDLNSLASYLEAYLNDRSLLEMHKYNSKRLYETELNWNIEQSIFLEQIDKSI